VPRLSGWAVGTAASFASVIPVTTNSLFGRMNSLFADKNSLFWRSREFACNALELLGELMRNAVPDWREICKFPVIFPVIRESGAQAGHVSAACPIGFEFRKRCSGAYLRSCSGPKLAEARRVAAPGLPHISAGL